MSICARFQNRRSRPSPRRCARTGSASFGRRSSGLTSSRAQGEYTWDLYDPIVRNLNDAGIQMVAVVEGAPFWAAQPGSQDGTIAAPANAADFASFLSQFVGRYGAYIDYVQVWDRPNDPTHWGGFVATADQYVGILAPAFNAIRTANGQTQVILAEFSDTGAGNVVGDDIRFLRRVYDVGGAPYFDAAAASIDGGEASPYDRRVSGDTASLSRAELFRETLSQEGDDTKPVWITHYGWDLGDGISRQTQADYLVAGMQRIRTEWPWAGPVFQWALLPQQAGPGNEGRALLESDGTSTAAFESVTSLVDEGVGTVAPTGFVPMDSGPVTYSGAWNDQHLDGQVFKTTSEVGATSSITFEGTGIVVYLRRSPDAGLIRATLDGCPFARLGRGRGRLHHRPDVLSDAGHCGDAGIEPRRRRSQAFAHDVRSGTADDRRSGRFARSTVAVASGRRIVYRVGDDDRRTA